MAITLTARIPLSQWSVDTDQPPTRPQMNADFASIANLAALSYQGTSAGRGAASTRGKFYWATDDRGGRLSYDDGASWFDLGPGPVQGRVSGHDALIDGGSIGGATTGDSVLTVRGRASQSGNLLTVQSSTPTTLAQVNSAGELAATGANNRLGAGSLGGTGTNLRLGDAGQATNAFVIAEGSPADVNLGLRGKGTGNVSIQTPGGTATLSVSSVGATSITPTSASVVSLLVAAPSGQTGNLLELQVNGAAKAKILPDGSAQHLGADHYFGPYAMGTGTTVSRLRVGTTTSSVTLYAEGDTGDRSLNLRSLGAGTIDFRKSDATLLARIDPAAGFSAGDASIGAGVLGGSGTYAQVGTLGSADKVWLDARGTPADIDVWVRPKGVGSIKLSSSTTVPLLTVASTGATSITPTSASVVSLLVAAPSGQTGNLLELQVNGVAKAKVLADGSAQHLGTDHYFGPYAMGTGTSVTRLHLFQASATVAEVAAEGDGANVGLWLVAKGTSAVTVSTGGGLTVQGNAVGTVPLFVNATTATTANLLELQVNSVAKAKVLADGSAQHLGADHYFGPYTFGTGTTVSRLHLGLDGGAAYLYAEGDGADRGMVFRQKGVGTFEFQTPGAAKLLTVTSAGKATVNTQSGNPTIALDVQYLGTSKVQLWTDGGIIGIGTASKLGAGANGAASGYVAVGDDGAGAGLIAANHGTGSNANLRLRAKGSGFPHLSDVQLETSGGVICIAAGGAAGSSTTAGVGFYGQTPVAQMTITGSRGGNAALANLLSALLTLNLVIDNTTA